MPRDFVLHIPGEVGGKGRPRTRIIFQSDIAPVKEEVEDALSKPRWLDACRRMFNGRPLPVIYPDPESEHEERMVKGLAFAQMAGRPLFEGPVELTIEVFRNQPKSWTQKARDSAAGFFATGKPDVDNVIKLIGDAFNKTVWNDDSQIADVIMRRRFTEHMPSVVVRVASLERQDKKDLLSVIS